MRLRVARKIMKTAPRWGTYWRARTRWEAYRRVDRDFMRWVIRDLESRGEGVIAAALRRWRAAPPRERIKGMGAFL